MSADKSGKHKMQKQSENAAPHDDSGDVATRVRRLYFAAMMVVMLSPNVYTCTTNSSPQPLEPRVANVQ